MTTNETIFFRDIEPFEVLRKEVLPATGPGPEPCCCRCPKRWRAVPPP